MDHVERPVDELERVFRLDELGYALQHQFCHQKAVDDVDDDHTHEDRDVVPVDQGDLLQEVHREVRGCFSTTLSREL